MNITCFYEPLIVNNKLTDFSRDCHVLIKAWEKSWSDHGWNPIVTSSVDAKKHHRYDEIDLKNYSSNLYKYSVNGPEYLELCYSRWFAYGIHNGAWSDYDVINYGFTPEDAESLSHKEPVFFDSIGSCGFSTIKGHDLIIDGIIMAYQEDTITNNLLLLQQKHNQTQEISDMHINRRQHSPISFLNNLCEDDFSNDEWRKSTLVHYHNGLWNYFDIKQYQTRIKFIQTERPI